MVVRESVNEAIFRWIGRDYRDDCMEVLSMGERR